MGYCKKLHGDSKFLCSAYGFVKNHGKLCPYVCPYENPRVDNPWVSVKIKTMGNHGVLAI